MSRIRADISDDCQRCGLCEQRTQIVFGIGSPRADLMIIGEAPGVQEDQQGEPFVGQAGGMLKNQLEAVLGLTRDDVYITNIVKCRPPDNRDPNEGEIDACMHFLKRQIAVVKSKAILLLGSIATKAFFGEGIRRTRGKWMEWGGHQVMATFHPAYLLRKPIDKSYTYEDLLMVKRKLDLN